MTHFVADSNDLYRDPAWWDDEYKKCKKGDNYEWFSSDDRLMETIYRFLENRDMKIINIGCGISCIQNLIFDRGFHDITNIDISPTCINIMKEADKRGMKWEVADILKPFPYEPETFDLAIDKGTLDAIIVDKADQWEIEDDVYKDSDFYFENVYRVLKKGGRFIQITFGQPHFRKRLFERPNLDWKVIVHTIQPEHSFHFFCYECVKNNY